MGACRRAARGFAAFAPPAPSGAGISRLRQHQHQLSLLGRLGASACSCHVSYTCHALCDVVLCSPPHPALPMTHPSRPSLLPPSLSRGACQFFANIPEWYGAFPDTQYNFAGSCGRCYEVACVNSNFSDRCVQGCCRPLRRPTSNGASSFCMMTRACSLHARTAAGVLLGPGTITTCRMHACMHACISACVCAVPIAGTPLASRHLSSPCRLPASNASQGHNPYPPPLLRTCSYGTALNRDGACYDTSRTVVIKVGVGALGMPSGCDIRVRSGCGGLRLCGRVRSAGGAGTVLACGLVKYAKDLIFLVHACSSSVGRRQALCMGTRWDPLGPTYPRTRWGQPFSTPAPPPPPLPPCRSWMPAHACTRTMQATRGGAVGMPSILI